MKKKNTLLNVLTNEGITQTDLAFESGLSYGTINRVCNQKMSISLTSQNKILKALNKLATNRYELEDIFI